MASAMMADMDPITKAPSKLLLNWTSAAPPYMVDIWLKNESSPPLKPSTPSPPKAAATTALFLGVNKAFSDDTADLVRLTLGVSADFAAIFGGSVVDGKHILREAGHAFLGCALVHGEAAERVGILEPTKLWTHGNVARKRIKHRLTTLEEPIVPFISKANTLVVKVGAEPKHTLFGAKLLLVLRIVLAACLG
jgi:hypothetical protein